MSKKDLTIPIINSFSVAIGFRRTGKTSLVPIGLENSKRPYISLTLERYSSGEKLYTLLSNG